MAESFGSFPIIFHSYNFSGSKEDNLLAKHQVCLIHITKINYLSQSLNSEECFKICYFHILKRKPKFFSFFISSDFHLYLLSALVFGWHRSGIHKINIKITQNEIQKYTWVFFLYKYSKFWSISLEFKLENKSFLLEVCSLTLGCSFVK